MEPETVKIPMSPDSRNTRPAQASSGGSGLALEVLTIGAVLIVTLALLVQALVSSALPLASARSFQTSRSALDRRECLLRALHAAIPRDTSAYFGSQATGPTQELLELDYGWATPVPTSTKAAWLVSLHPGQGPGSCNGVVLRATRRP